MFAIGRTSGWIAQWLEMVEDKEQKIARPRQIYTGERDARLRADRRSAAERSCPRCAVTAAHSRSRDRASRRSRGDPSRQTAPSVVIRPIRPEDKPLLADGLGAALGRRRVAQRFLAPKPRFTAAELRYLTEVDFRDHDALVATPRERPGRDRRRRALGPRRARPGRGRGRRSSSPTTSRARASARARPRDRRRRARPRRAPLHRDDAGRQRRRRTGCSRRSPRGSTSTTTARRDELVAELAA